jgi:hypothetical protein
VYAIVTEFDVEVDKVSDVMDGIVCAITYVNVLQSAIAMLPFLAYLTVNVYADPLERPLAT